MWGDKIELGNWVETISYGQPVRSITWTTVFADKKSVRQSEFYANANVGLKPELMFVIHAKEYKGHEMVRYPVTSGKTYAITRHFEQGEIVELICTAQVGDLSG